MKREMSRTCGLTPRQEIYWMAVKTLTEANGEFPRGTDVYMLVERRTNSTGACFNALKVCVKRGFLRRLPDRRYEALEAPHDIIIRQVCEQLQVAKKELFSGCRRRMVTRARRLITRQLRKRNYMVSDIARLLGRHESIVSDYGNPDKRLRRSIERMEYRKQQRTAQAESAAMQT